MIAACYGTAYRFGKTGKVLDAATRAGVAGVTVTCVAGGRETRAVRTAANGSFQLMTQRECDELRVADGAGARYAATSVPGGATDDVGVIALQPAK
ncbi:MAG TPA: hypothetical protein VGQ83_30165 [Polyangia bacterium]